MATTIAGCLSGLPLAEILQILEEGRRTGRLMLKGTAAIGNPSQTSYIWLEDGQIVAASNCLDRGGLLREIERRGWLRNHIARTIFKKCPSQALGTSLHKQGALDKKQLQLLFLTQVMQPICSILTFNSGNFSFEASELAPASEKTGLRKPATEMMFVGLRALKNWPPSLLGKLPASTARMAKVSPARSPHQLGYSAQEQQVLKELNGTASLQAIAEQLQLPLETVQKIAFRLQICSRVEEVEETTGAVSLGETSKTKLSHSFLNRLASLLRTWISGTSDSSQLDTARV